MSLFYENVSLFFVKSSIMHLKNYVVRKESMCLNLKEKKNQEFFFKESLLKIEENIQFIWKRILH